MQSKKDNDRASTSTRPRGLLAMLRGIYERVFHPPALLVRLRGEPNALYPSMSRREIHGVAQAICESALRDAK